jgi:hypothetical protein
LLVVAVVALQLAGVDRAAAATLDVCRSGCPYRQLGPAVAAAHDGDTIRMGPGTYLGGVTIDVSVRVIGADAGSTVLRGGGPVLTIGAFGAAVEPTVSLEGLTITGGVTRSSPQSVDFVGEGGVIALGGGIEIPPNADFTGGATVTVSDSVISGNRVAPTHALPLGPPCPHGPCPFALAAGGGIDSWGRLTLEGSTVSGNLVGTASGLSDVASDAVGGGIRSWLDDLTISDSVIGDNAATATAPNGRFAEGGGIHATNGSVAIADSAVTGNRTVLQAALPASVEMLAQSGGFFIDSDGLRATVTGSSISGNSVSMTNTVGDATAFSGGINIGPAVNFAMRDSVISDNRVSASTLRGSRGNAEGDTGGAAVLGTVARVEVTGNTVTVLSASGDATAAIGGLIHTGTLSTSIVSGNHVRASSPRGSATVLGAGILVAEAGLTIRASAVTGNTGEAFGRRGLARGGGIYDGPIFDLVGSPLVLSGSTVSGNTLTASGSITVEGGGLFVQDQPVTLIHTEIEGNAPDQCVGC